MEYQKPKNCETTIDLVKALKKLSSPCRFSVLLNPKHEILTIAVLMVIVYKLGHRMSFKLL